MRKEHTFQIESDYKPAGDQPKAIEGLLKGLQNGERYQTLLGVTGSGKTFTMANIIEKVQKPTLVIAPNKTLAAQLYQEYKSFFPHNKVCYFVSYYDYYQPEAYLPTTDTYIEKESLINEEIDRFRHVATSSLLTRPDTIVVASVSCIYNLGVPENYFDSILHLVIDQPITRESLIKHLVKIGFTRNQTALKRGNFRVRGDVFEIIAAAEEVVYRVEIGPQADTSSLSRQRPDAASTRSDDKTVARPRLGRSDKVIDVSDPVPPGSDSFDQLRRYSSESKHEASATSESLVSGTNESGTREEGSVGLGAGQKVKQLSLVDAVSRKIKEELPDLIIFPPKHFVTTIPERERAIKDIKDELKERLKFFEKNKMPLEAERLERRTKYDMEMIKTLGFCHGIENYSRHLSGKAPGSPPDSLLAYFPKDKNGKPDFLTIIDESHVAVPQIAGMFAGDQSRKKVLVEFGWRLPSALDNRPLNFKEFEQRIGPTIFTSATPGDFEKEHSTNVVEQIVRPTGLVDPPIEVRPVFDQKKNRSQIDDVMEEAIKTAKKGDRTLILTLTKKMAEELDQFLREKGFKSNYMHADTKTFERTRILEAFRRGPSAGSGQVQNSAKKKGLEPTRREYAEPIEGFDILIGINLLREGLDLPEVSLVAILDADREGFLRGETALIQTMGRAARNVDGRVILYADKETEAMKSAIRECERRRKIQLAYNAKHKITPKTVRKAVREME